MNNIIDLDSYMKKKYVKANRCGTITISVYEDPHTNHPLFYVESSNQLISPISEVIENTLYNYKDIL